MTGAVSVRAYTLVLGVALAASVASLRNGFVYDDVWVIEKDARVHSLSGLPRLLTEPYWTRDRRDRIYRPVTTASFALTWAMGGGSPLSFHAANVALHLVVVSLVLALAGALLGRGAVVAALWFAVHPIHVEAVANAVGRAELLAAAAYLGAVLAYRAEGEAARAAPDGRRRAVLALTALACAALAFGSKEHALTLPAALLVTDFWDARVAGEMLRARLARRALLLGAVLVLAVGYLAARAAVAGAALGGGNVAAGLENLTVAGRLIVMVPAALVWARLFVFPLHLSVDYSPNAFVPAATLGPSHALALVLVAGAAALVWRLRRRAPALGFALAWLAVTTSVAANVVVPTGVLIAERVLYLPSVGVAIAAGALWELLPATRAVWTATAVALALLSTRTLARIPVWQDEERFYQALLTDAPRSYRSHWARGARAFDRGDARTGEREYREAISIFPLDAAVYQELGERYLAAGLFDAADRFLTASYRLDSLRSDAAFQAVEARTRAGRPDSAVALGEEALRRFPGAPMLLLATSDAQLALQRPLRALVLLRRIAYEVPGSWRSHYGAAYAAALAGRCDEARTRLARALALAPTEAAPQRLAAELAAGSTCGVSPA